jgi:hypothetical protein
MAAEEREGQETGTEEAENNFYGRSQRKITSSTRVREMGAGWIVVI